MKAWLISLIVIMAGLVYFIPGQMQTSSIQIGSRTVEARVARTAAEQAQGLAGVKSLADYQGMVFVYDPPSRPTFWMKGMVIPIDIIWIADGEVIGWEANVPPDDGAKLYPAPVPVDRVLEVRSGWAKDHGIKLGDLVEYQE